NVFSQSAGQALAMGQDVNVLFRNESTGNISLHSRGFSVNYRRLWHVTGTRKRLIEFELLNMRHPKEQKIKHDHGKSYYYGKLNTLTFIRAGYGYQQTLYRRAERKSIEVRMVYSVGPTLCFAKPVFLEVQYPDTISSGGDNMITKIEAYDPAKHNQYNILGRAPIFYGLNHTSVYPGAHAKLGFSFEYGETRTSIKALETGVVVDYFPKAIQTMAYVSPENFFVTLYVGFTFGKRWF
ncbi:MAG TPA: hypothetical protein VNY73_01705, partial [Bacteroidia bacterium]|nr:hypothetical protein [Bacteroidia bacterium]